MKRFAMMAVLLLAGVFLLGGCTCSDGAQNWGFGSSSYRACNRKCCKTGAHDKNNCNCSSQCPCWK